MAKNLIKTLHDEFDKRKICVYMDDDEYFLFVFHGLSFIFLEEDCFHLSFEVNCSSTISAHITQDVIEFATKHKKEVQIIEPFADVIDDEGIIVQTLYGEDAIHYQETGETPEDEDVKEEEETENVLNDILDKISKTGMNSLSKKQKEFLISYSKGKHKH